LTGVITEAMFEKNVLRLQEEQLERESSRAYISQRCSTFFGEIKTNEFGEAPRTELVLLLPRVAEMLESMNVQFTRDELVHLLEVMDTDGSGAINKTEFCRALLHLAERGEELQPMLMMELQQDAITFVKRKVERLETSVGRLEKSHADMYEILKMVAAHIAASTSQAPTAGEGTPSAAAHATAAAPAAATLATTGPMSLSVPSAAIKLMPSSSDLTRTTTNGSYNRDSRSSNTDRDGLGLLLPVKDSQGLLLSVKESVLKMDQTLCGLQGDIFSIGSRVEEVVSDARSEQISSQLGELAVRRRCMEFESSVSTRLTSAENAARQAQKASEESGAQVAALVAQVQALTKAMESRHEDHRVPPGAFADRNPASTHAVDALVAVG